MKPAFRQNVGFEITDPPLGMTPFRPDKTGRRRFANNGDKTNYGSLPGKSVKISRAAILQVQDMTASVRASSSSNSASATIGDTHCNPLQT